MSEVEIPVPSLDVSRNISDYLENDVDAETRARTEAHFKECSHCTSVLGGARNVLRLVGDGRSFELPQWFGGRLYEKLKKEGMAK